MCETKLRPTSLPLRVRTPCSAKSSLKLSSLTTHFEPIHAEATLASVAGQISTSDDAVIVFEHSRSALPPTSLGPFGLLRTRTHGTSSVSFYTRATSEGTE